MDVSLGIGLDYYFLSFRFDILLPFFSLLYITMRITNEYPEDKILNHVIDSFKIKSTMTNVQKFLKNMVHTDDLESWLIDDMRRIFYKFDTSGDGQVNKTIFCHF